MTDYYELLKIPSSSDEVRIRKAYYKLAKLWHPDKNSDQGAVNKFQEISVAYKTLSDASSRRTYDIQLFLDSKHTFLSKKPEFDAKQKPDTKATFEYIYNLFKKGKEDPVPEVKKKRQREF